MIGDNVWNSFTQELNEIRNLENAKPSAPQLRTGLFRDVNPDQAPRAAWSGLNALTYAVIDFRCARSRQPSRRSSLARHYDGETNSACAEAWPFDLPIPPIHS